jgi:5-aminolevulinate synthase
MHSGDDHRAGNPGIPSGGHGKVGGDPGADQPGARAQHQSTAKEQELIIEAIVAKAFDCLGGYIAGSANLIDAVRSHAPGYIFSTALPPAICAGALAAVRHLKISQLERDRHQDQAARVKAVLNAAGLPVMSNDTHIVPVLIGDPDKCKEASDLLLAEHGIYIQSINYPTVPRGTERLRITPTPYHDDALIDALAKALIDVWGRLGLPLQHRALAAEGVRNALAPNSQKSETFRLVGSDDDHLI